MATLLDDLLSGFTIKRAQDWLRQKFSSYDASLRLAITLACETKNERAYFDTIQNLGVIRKLAGETAGQNHPVLVVAVKMKHFLTERTSRQIQFNFAKRILQEAVRTATPGLEGYPSQGLFFFYDSKGFFRISLVGAAMEGRHFKFNEAKRQSFYINPERPNNVAKIRLQRPIRHFADLKEVFSVETLTKEFYNSLFVWYEWAMKTSTGVTFPNDENDKTDDSKYNNEAIIRLITRLMFTWFIRQRGMVKDELFKVEGVAPLLRDFDPESMEQHNYYRCILQNLFFATFNCHPEKRRFRDRNSGNGSKNDSYGVKTLYRYEREFEDAKRFKELMRKVPFLNCALFDCLDKKERKQDGGRSLIFDGFSDVERRQAHVPNALFFHPDKGIIKLFDTYEFTIDENSADDADIALDPELLGKVFENLLGAFNPETKETARKATGSFYTPREIVDYMVSESLKNYLRTKVPNLEDAWLKVLFDKTKSGDDVELPFGDEVAAQLREALYECKILDPACGSGAFPMGILHCMVRLFERLDPGNCDLTNRLIARYKRETNQPVDPLETQKEREERLKELKVQLDEGQHYPDYARKLYLIENCIYGVDIQPIATQISKLRFFISLLCDQLRSNYDPDAENNGLLSLPNLEAKFVCANTLMSLPKTEGELALATSGIPNLRDRLQRNRHHIFSARTYTKKAKLKAKDLEIRDQILEAVRSTLATPNEELIKQQETTIQRLQGERVAYALPKWEMVQKAVQGSLFGEMEQGEIGFERIDVNKVKRDEIDAKILQAQRAITSERAKSSAGNATAIDKLATLVASWDPYDQNTSSSFFDPQWMFNINEGFDIVIGNPPYGAKVSASDKRYFEQNYESAKTVKGKQKGSTDTFSLFIEKAFDITKLGGNTIFILPMSIVSSASMTALHNLLFSNCEEMKCSSYAVRPQPVFENAVVNTTILQFKRTNTPLQTIETTKMYRKGKDFDLNRLVQNLEFVNSKPYLLSGRIPKIGETVETLILEKMFRKKALREFVTIKGEQFYYRTSGGRYFKIVTDYSTGSNKEKGIVVASGCAKLVAACLSSSLGFWFYQIYSNNLDWKTEEILSFPIPDFTEEQSITLQGIFNRYIADVEKHAKSRKVSESSKYTMDQFKEYKIGYSKKIIDEIDDFIGPLYGLTQEEVDFIKNYEIEFRMADYLTEEELSALRNPKATESPKQPVSPSLVRISRPVVNKPTPVVFSTDDDAN